MQLSDVCAAEAKRRPRQRAWRFFQADEDVNEKIDVIDYDAEVHTQNMLDQNGKCWKTILLVNVYLCFFRFLY